MSDEKKKKGWLSGLADLVMEPSTEESTDTSTESVSTPSTTPVAATVSAPVAPVYTATSPSSTSDGIFDQKFNEAFQALIAENNIPGIDYFEFRQALDNMSSVAGMNEASSFQAVFSTLKFGDPNLDKNKLISSIDHYDAVLVKEEQEFNTALQSKMTEEVTSRKERADALMRENEEFVLEIQRINEKMSKNQIDSIQLKSEAAVEEANLNQKSKNFAATMASVRTKLAEDKQKISTIIQ